MFFFFNLVVVVTPDVVDIRLSQHLFLSRHAEVEFVHFKSCTIVQAVGDESGLSKPKAAIQNNVAEDSVEDVADVKELLQSLSFYFSPDGDITLSLQKQQGNECPHKHTYTKTM